jgi:hypothetical protein
MLCFFIYFRQKIGEYLAFFTLNKAELFKTLIITLVFIFKKGKFFRRKLAKIAENCDHNIDPRSHWQQSTQEGSHYLRNIVFGLAVYSRRGQGCQMVYF